MIMSVYLPAAIIGLLIVFLAQRYFHLPTSFDWSPAKPSSNANMTAIVYQKGSSVLQLDKSFPRPQVTSDGILILVKASSINPCDFKIKRNSEVTPDIILPKPKIPGEDVAGIVVEVGKRVSKFKKGDRVAAMMPVLGSQWGSAAEYVSVKAAFAAHIPEKVDFVTAAAYPLVALTAMQALKNVAVKKTESAPKILIHAGAGGVGSFAIQYAKRVLGMYVATTASSKKASKVKSWGADVVIDYKTQNFEEVIQDYDIVLDTMSWAYEQRTFGSKVLKRTGHYLNVLSSDWALSADTQEEVANGPVTFVNAFKSKLINLFSGKIFPKYDLVGVEPNGKDLETLMHLLGNKTIHAVIDRKFDLTQAKKAYEYLEKGHATGKVMLVNH